MLWKRFKHQVFAKLVNFNFCFTDNKKYKYTCYGAIIVSEDKLCHTDAYNYNWPCCQGIWRDPNEAFVIAGTFCGSCDDGWTGRTFRGRRIYDKTTTTGKSPTTTVSILSQEVPAWVWWVGLWQNCRSMAADIQTAYIGAFLIMYRIKLLDWMIMLCGCGGF